MLFFIAFVFLNSCSVKYTYNVSRQPSDGLQQPVKIYIDKKFSSKEEGLINVAFVAWERASNYTVSFIPVWGSTTPENFLEGRYSENSYMWLLDKTEKHFTSSELQRIFYIDGNVVYRTPSPQIIIFKTSYEGGFYRIVLHEIGHMLGLSHIDGSAVMNKNATSYCITSMDADQLCKIYDCTPRPECF